MKSEQLPLSEPGHALTMANDAPGANCCMPRLITQVVEGAGLRHTRTEPGWPLRPAHGGRGRTFMSACRRNESRLYAETHRVVMVTQVSILIYIINVFENNASVHDSVMSANKLFARARDPAAVFPTRRQSG